MTETSPETNEQPSVWPYQGRSGVNSDRYIEEILSAQEKTLSEEDYAAAKAFAKGLFYGKHAETIVCESSRDLEKIYQSSAKESINNFYLDYFSTEAGRQALGRLGIESGEPAVIEQGLYDIEGIKERVSVKDRKQIAADSLNWYKDRLTDELLKSEAEDKDFKDYPSISVNYDPEKLIYKLEDLQAYRRFYREVRRDIKAQPASELRSAKEAVLAAHRARVNEMMADLYISSISLTDQLQKGAGAGPTKRLAAAMPALKATFLQAREDRVFSLEELAGRFSRRLDFIRNGAAWTDSDDFSPISSELEALATELEARVESLPPVADAPRVVVEKLEKNKWDAGQLLELARSVMSEWGLLSSAEASWTEVEERDGFAEDGKWQVVISPKVKSMSVSGAKRTLRIPESYDRPLVQEYPAGVLSGLAHELMHVIQNEAANLVGDDIPLAKIKGRHVSALKELGTISQERQMQERFGAKRDVNLHYLRALKVKLAGGNKIQAARAFYNSYTQGAMLSPEKNQAARLQSADRALRLFRHGGNESQPLDYIEQELLGRQLDSLERDDQNRILILGSVFDLQDLARLVGTGLIKYPDNLPYNVADDVWRIFSREHAELITQSI